ncbi:MerR family transcriptional regulator [Nocardia flavorosea]|uniref:MerR family transcriptional regulator n=1 Tax=Nocardia flavorosea TaxID=53429 RepID=A0A846Y6W3_9NOCA|nr:MerR family transcriptional regulator [Nocardia flavorosea]NKY55306.1 MerR family transcriptional regulator [Nocardia flavorosea]
MSWSTRELAELAGTSVRTVRHYHDVGLLEQPERGSNGYKRYGVAHLLRVLRIKRLADLGIPLSRIADMGENEYPRESLHTLDAELAATIERLQRIRMELALILRQGSHTDLPPDLTPVSTEFTEADRAYTVIANRVLGPTALDSLREFLTTGDATDPAMTDFDNLPADADEQTRERVAEQVAPYARKLHTTYPNLSTVHDSPVGPQRAVQALALALKELYNEAQFDVLLRVSRLLTAAEQD